MKRYPNVYFLTLTLDSPQEVARLRHTYLLTRGFNFAQDSKGEFFRVLRQRGVAVTPYALIFDGNGTLLWEGHPISSAVEGHLARLNAVPIHPVIGSSYAITGPAWWRTNAEKDQAKREEAFNKEITRRLADTEGMGAEGGAVASSHHDAEGGPTGNGSDSRDTEQPTVARKQGYMVHGPKSLSTNSME